MIHNMSKRRVVKQAVYGGIYLIIAVVVIVGGVRLWNNAGSPAVSATPTPFAVKYQEIVIEDLQVINHPTTTLGIGNTIDVVMRLKNPNAAAGIIEYPVEFMLKDSSGNTITSKKESTYILPGAVQYVLALGVPIGNASVSRVEVVTPQNPEYVDITADIPLPRFSSFARSRSNRSIGDTVVEEQLGTIKNDSTVDWHKVEMVAIALTAENKVVGAGKTFVGDLRVGEQRDFTIQWPATSASTAKVLLVPSTNIFEEENILRMIGNPESLR